MHNSQRAGRSAVQAKTKPLQRNSPFPEEKHWTPFERTFMVSMKGLKKLPLMVSDFQTIEVLKTCFLSSYVNGKVTINKQIDRPNRNIAWLKHRGTICVKSKRYIYWMVQWSIVFHIGFVQFPIIYVFISSTCHISRKALLQWLIKSILWKQILKLGDYRYFQKVIFLLITRCLAKIIWANCLVMFYCS